jgi:thymidylate synthase (FAD)
LSNQNEPADLYKWSVQHQYFIYNQLLDMGVCREQARLVLPLSTFSECYWTCTLQALIHFLKLRLAKDAQAEITYYAEAIQSILERDEDMKFILEVCL